MTVSERFFHINGYRLAAREWFETSATKVIACHGWLDNAASFDVLAPLLPHCHIVALDMPGHGRSDHKPLQAHYNIWDDLLDILAVADQLGWQSFNLLGHSRGAMMSMMLAAAMPERVSSLVMLDAIAPQAVDVSETAVQLARFLTDQRNIQHKKLPSFTSLEQAIAVRSRASKMTEAAARLIVERGLVLVDGRYQWVNDPRLNTASAVKMTEQHNRVLLGSIAAPNLVLLAEQGLGSRKEYMELCEGLGNIVCQRISGGHHFHMEQQAEEIAELISRLLAKSVAENSG